VGPTLFLLFFFASAIWVAAIVDAAQDADILPALCRARRGGVAVTQGGALLMVRSSSSLPADESEMYSSMHCCGGLHVLRSTDLETSVLLVAQQCRAPVDAFTKLKTKKGENKLSQNRTSSQMQ
jgi:hypothetical protein